MAAKFWVGGGTNTNWNSSPVTNWANISGGTGNQTAPATGDDVTFDNASGVGASVWNTPISLNSLVCTNSRNLVSGTAAITISGGNLALPGGVGATYSHTGTFTFTGTAGTQTITSNGKTFPNLTLNGVGGTFQLQDDLTSLTGNTITLTNGTFDAQTFAVTIGNFTSNVANVRTLKGSGLWTLLGTGTVWNLTAGSLTSTNFSSSITCTATSTGVRTFTGGGLAVYGTLTINANSSKGSFGINSANTFAGLNIAGPNAIYLPSGTINTVSSVPIITGSPGSEVSLNTSSPGTQATLSVASGAPAFTYTFIREIAFTGGATFGATNSYDQGRNSGITITPPAAAGVKYRGNMTGNMNA